METGPLTDGPKPPDVISPISSLDVSDENSFVSARIGALPSGKRPTRLRGAPSLNCASTFSAPGKPPSRSPPARLAFWIAQVRAASTGVVVSSMSLP